jgi:hypothetical protein
MCRGISGRPGSAPRIGHSWSQRWDVAAAQRAGIYSYRASLAGLDDESPA